MKTKSSHSSLKWGFKFFSSKTCMTKIELHKLYDFKLKHFEEFENVVQRRFESTVSTTNISGVNTIKVKPSDCISKALTQVLSDFNWEQPDITSPVKKTRHRKEVQHSNFVILFSKCPKAAVQLKRFCGKQVPDDDVFLDSILPSSLYHQFNKVFNVSLYWIDTQHISFQKDVDLHSVSIIEQALSKAGGRVLPLDVVVNNGSPYYVGISSLLQDIWTEEEVARYTAGTDVTNVSNIMPSMIVLSAWLKADKSSGNVSASNHLVCTLEVGTHEVALDLSPSGTVDNSHLLKQPRCLRAYGILQGSCGIGFCLECRYVACEKIRLDAVHKKQLVLDGCFQKLLADLVVRNRGLIVMCVDTGHLWLLEPLTVHTASLSLLSHVSLLSLEKQLLAQEMERVTVLDENELESGSYDTLINKMVSKKQLQGMQAVAQPLVEPFDVRCLDRWYIPGPSSTFKRFVSKFNQHMSNLEFMSPEEAGVLKQLQKSYRLENKPPGLTDTPVVNNLEPPKEELPDKFELPAIGKASRMSFSRADVILSKSKQVVEQKERVSKIEEGTCAKRPERVKLEIPVHLYGFRSIEELKSYLTSTYENVISGESTNMESTIQTLVTVALHYFRQTEQQNQEETCKLFLRDCLILSGSKLREKCTTYSSLLKEKKSAEYQAQVLLRLEMMSTVDHKDLSNDDKETTEEIVSLLRTLSFISEPGFLSQFLQKSLLYNYMNMIPRTLATICDELMQPLPDALADLLSPSISNSIDQSVLSSTLAGNYDTGSPPSTRTRSHASAGLSSCNPGSTGRVSFRTSNVGQNGKRKLVHHPSLSDFGTKRQIIVQNVSRPKVKVNKKTNKDSYKKPREKELLSPRRRFVAETPRHKQVSQALHRRVQCRLSSTTDAPSVDVVEESPLKACGQLLKYTPTKGKRAKALLKRSFYPSGPIKKTRSLSQYFQLADKIAARQSNGSKQSQNEKRPSKLLSFETPSEFKSPNKNSSFLQSQLMWSPSPKKVVPQKLTCTSSKLAESTILNVRSGIVASPVTDLLQSPNRFHIAPAAVHVTKSPVSRRHSQPLLVPMSDNITQNKYDQTPEKNAIYGIISCGLDSPSENTRQKKLQTPTRRSVRAALFSDSPSTDRNLSASKGTASPKTLLAKFGLPVKQVALKSFESDSATLPRKLARMTPKKSQSPREDTQKLQIFTSAKNKSSTQVLISAEVSSDHKILCSTSNSLINNNKDTNNELSCSSTRVKRKRVDSGQKTPSPHNKKSTKTSDSFNKWHRRKPRSVHNSPCIKLQSVSIMSPIKPMVEHDTVIQVGGDMVKCASQECSDSKTEDNGKLKNIVGVLRNKRSFPFSPDKSLESPSKWRKVSCNMMSAASAGSQGFEPMSSFDQLSSGINTGDYFSSMSDEVFLSNSTDNLSQKHIAMSTKDIENNKSINIHEISLKHGRIERKKNRIFSDDILLSDHSDSERPASPIFGIKTISNRSRNISEEKHKLPENVDQCENTESSLIINLENKSPNLRKSPSGLKYSPNVSVTSLMHLIQSPLLHSPDSRLKKMAITHSPSRPHTNRTRRSLKLPT